MRESGWNDFSTPFPLGKNHASSPCNCHLLSPSPLFLGRQLASPRGDSELRMWGQVSFDNLSLWCVRVILTSKEKQRRCVCIQAENPPSCAITLWRKQESWFPTIWRRQAFMVLSLSLPYCYCQSTSGAWFFVTPWTTAHQASLSFTISQSLLRLLSIESMIPSNQLILCSLLCSVFPSIRVFSNESAFQIRWSKYWSFTFNLSLSNSVLISFRIDWFALLAVQGTLESSPAPQFESISSFALNLLYGPTLTSVHYYWKNHSFE